MPFGVGGGSGSSQLAPGQVTNVPVTDKGSIMRQGGGLSQETITFKVGPAGVINSVVQCPAYRVGRGQRVQLLAASGASSVSQTRETAAAQLGDAIPNGVLVDYPVDNTGKLFFFLAGAGDSVQVRITSGQ